MTEAIAILQAIDLVKKIPGDFIEFGVLQGTTAVQMMSRALAQGKKYHGVDSFEGMGVPGPHDKSPSGYVRYPKGKFKLGSKLQMAEFVADRLLKECGPVTPRDFQLWVGFVPGVLRQITLSSISLAYVDMDHYQPTVDALHWIWERLSLGGVILCDDVFARADWLASKAVTEFVEKHATELEMVGVFPDQAMFRRLH